MARNSVNDGAHETLAVTGSVNDGAHETLAVTGSVNDGADETLAVTEVSCAQSKLPAPHAYHISTITASLLAPDL